MSCTGFEEGFYSTDSGKIIYLSRTTEGFVAESRTGSTFKVYETTFDSSVKGNLNRLKEALWQIPIK